MKSSSMGLKPMTEKLRMKIREYAKNHKDISDVIEGVNIKGEDLSRTTITRLTRIAEDLSGTNFANAVIGTDDNIVTISNCKARNCCFKGTRFPGRLVIRKTDFRGSNFTECWFPNVEYQYSDFRQCKWCDCVIRIGSREGMGARFDLALFRQLTRYWNVDGNVGEGMDNGVGSCGVGEEASEVARTGECTGETV